MKAYHATKKFIHHQVEPELKVELPNIPKAQQLQPLQHVEEDQTLVDEEHLTYDNKCPRVTLSSS